MTNGASEPREHLGVRSLYGLSSSPPRASNLTTTLEQAQLIRLSGDVTAVDRATLERVLSGRGHKIIDCGDVRLLGDVGLEVFESMHARLGSFGWRMFILGLHSGALREAQMRGLSNILCGTPIDD
jgi:anti-anti-sigma regulatory factor